MLPRWLLALALMCGMLFAPVAMAAACMPMPSAGHAASHCAGGDAHQHGPAKQFHCMGACSGVEVEIARFVTPMASPIAAIPIPIAPSPRGVLPKLDSPPPRLS